MAGQERGERIVGKAKGPRNWRFQSVGRQKTKAGKADNLAGLENLPEFWEENLDFSRRAAKMLGKNDKRACSKGRQQKRRAQEKANVESPDGLGSRGVSKANVAMDL